MKLGVLARSGDKLCPTIAGLFAAGTFPQQYFPRLEVVFCAFPGTTKVPIANSNQRYLNAREIIGPIPGMIWETVASVQERMNTAAFVKNGLRHDVPDFPMAAVREAIANALQHRDYSPEGRGTHIQVNLYDDRLEILNPGGLYGSTDVENLGKDGISSSRNAFLSRLLTYTPFESGFVVENKGTGFRVIQSELERSGLPPPQIQSSPSFFRITFEKRRETSTGPAAAATASDPCKERMPQGTAPFKPAKLKGKELEAIALEKIREKGSVTAAELAALSGLSRPAVRLQLKAMLEKGMIEPTEANRSPKQRYRLKPANKEET